MPPSSACLARSMVTLTLVVGGLASCVAPVQWQRVPHEPSRFSYVGAHGVPLAFGGSVCAITDAHTHGYPPVPAAAFRDEERGARDTRALYAYVDPHPHHGRTCFRERWHLHLEPPSALLAYDEELDAFIAKADGKAPLLEIKAGHAPLSCQESACDFHAAHAHKPCEG